MSESSGELPRGQKRIRVKPAPKLVTKKTPAKQTAGKKAVAKKAAPAKKTVAKKSRWPTLRRSRNSRPSR
jgi:hypothetical protein